MFTEKQSIIIEFALTYLIANLDHAGGPLTDRAELKGMSEQELEEEVLKILCSVKQGIK
jgi:hypothetical protein